MTKVLQIGCISLQFLYSIQKTVFGQYITDKTLFFPCFLREHHSKRYYLNESTAFSSMLHETGILLHKELHFCSHQMILSSRFCKGKVRDSRKAKPKGHVMQCPGINRCKHYPFHAYGINIHILARNR